MPELLAYDEDTAFSLADDAATVSAIARRTAEERLRAARFGEWNAKEVIGHLADLAEVFAERVRRCVDEESPWLPSVDENALAGERRNGERDARELSKRLQAAHGAIIQLMRRPGAGERPAVHQEQGRVTAAHVAARCARHSREHVRELQEAFPPA